MCQFKAIVTHRYPSKIDDSGHLGQANRQFIFLLFRIELNGLAIVGRYEIQADTVTAFVAVLHGPVEVYWSILACHYRNAFLYFLGQPSSRVSSSSRTTLKISSHPKEFVCGRDNDSSILGKVVFIFRLKYISPLFFLCFRSM